MIVSHFNLTRLFRIKCKSFKICCFVNVRHDVKFLIVSKTNCLLQFFFVFRLFREKTVCYDRNWFFIKTFDYSENINDSLNFSNVLFSMIESQLKFKNLNLNENVNNDKRNKKQRRNRFNLLKNNIHIVNFEFHVLIAIYDDFSLNFRWIILTFQKKSIWILSILNISSFKNTLNILFKIIS